MVEKINQDEGDFDPDMAEGEVAEARAEEGFIPTHRELIALAKTHSLETIADRLRRSPTSILNRAARLGLKITGLKAKGK